MDVVIEVAPAVANAVVVEVVVTTTDSIPVHQTHSLIQRVVSIARPTLGSHSLSAVAPDHYFKEDVANAA